VKMYTGLARTYGGFRPEGQQDGEWEFSAERPWRGLARGEHALLIVVDDESKEALEELALHISIGGVLRLHPGLMVERVSFPLEPPEIPEEVKKQFKLKEDRQGTDEEGGDLGLISKAIMGKSVEEDLIIMDDPEKPKGWRELDLEQIEREERGEDDYDGELCIFCDKVVQQPHTCSTMPLKGPELFPSMKRDDEDGSQ